MAHRAQTYRGPVAASEPEEQALEALMAGLFNDQRGPNIGDPAPDNTHGIMISLHSYSELVLWPWGHLTTEAPNGPQLQRLGQKFASYNGYTAQQSYVLYPTSGTTDEWAYGVLGIAGYTFELGTDFFQYYGDMPAMWAARCADHRLAVGHALPLT